MLTGATAGGAERASGRGSTDYVPGIAADATAAAAAPTDARQRPRERGWCALFHGRRMGSASHVVIDVCNVLRGSWCGLLWLGRGQGMHWGREMKKCASGPLWGRPVGWFQLKFDKKIKKCEYLSRTGRNRKGGTPKLYNMFSELLPHTPAKKIRSGGRGRDYPYPALFWADRVDLREA